jgi:amino acid transporter
MAPSRKEPERAPSPPDPRGVELRERPSIRLPQGLSKQAGVDLAPRPAKRLSVWLATALCGNDITSSCLYVAAITTAYAGALAPFVLLIVAGVLYLYRNVYAEVGDALPLNGGAYNCLLNATTKYKASLAACMTILSYIATAVISAKTAMEYAGTFFSGFPVVPFTCALLAVFALLAILGIGESARVALVIFVLHLAVLAVFSVIGVALVASDPGRLLANLAEPRPHSVWIALFFGFSAAMLGVSGFESSANFIEEQAEGVFVKTLRNMWVIVSIFNPLIAAICLGVMPMEDIGKAQDFLLADAGRVMGGSWLQHAVAVDAVLVLSGAVLTSFVGVTGLVRRMALDRCLPQFLLKVNRRRTSHRIILSFLVLCVSIVLLTRGSLLALAGVYTISFLCVMSLFAVGNILLKIRRAKLPRNYRAGWLTVFLALCATLLGIVGNALMSPKNVGFFLTYFVPTFLIVSLMLFRHHLLRFVLTVANDMVARIRAYNRRINTAIQGQLDAIESHGVIFFTKGDAVSSLNRAVLYVLQNEITKRLTIIHVYEDAKDIPDRLRSDLKILDEIYPEIRIELVLRKGIFGPDLVKTISREFDIPENYMFIGAPGSQFPHRISTLGGVRVIM